MYLILLQFLFVDLITFNSFTLKGKTFYFIATFSNRHSWGRLCLRKSKSGMVIRFYFPFFPTINNKLDLGSIRSSLRYGLSTLCLYSLTVRKMRDLHLVLPALNLSTLNAGILIMLQKVRLMMFSLNMVDYSMSFLLLSTCVFCWTSRGDHSEPFLLFDF